MLAQNTVRVVTWLVALVSLLAAGPVLADDADPDALAIHVVSVKSEDALDQAEALTLALRKAVRDADGWSLADSRQSLEFLALKMGCGEPIDAACETRIADVLKADRFLWSAIQFDPNDPELVIGTVNLFVRGQGTKAASLNYSANLTDPNADHLVKVARAALAEVTGGAPQGTLRVTAGGVPAQLYIDGQPMGALPAGGASFQIASGPHRVLVRAPGYADAEGTATVKPSTTVELNLALVPMEESKPIDGRLVGGIVALSVGAAAGAVGLWAALEVNSIRNDDDFDRYRGFFNNTDNVCDRARSPETHGSVEANALKASVASQCDTAGTMEIIQAVMFPLAGVAAGVGIFLLGTSSLGDDDTEEASALWIEPILTPETQALTLRYRF